MTREIDPDDIEAGNLSFAEAEYLRVRGKLPADYEMPEPGEGEVVEPKAPETMEDVEILRYPIEATGTLLEDQTVPSIGTRGGIVEDDGEFEGVGGDYLDGWTNNRRRGELSKRGLSVDGTKDEMIARLRRSDGGSLNEDDYAEDDSE